MRLLVVTDSHLAADARAIVGNWHAAAAYALRAGIDGTIHLGDITLDAASRPEQLDEARAFVDAWPTPIRLIPGNHDVGDNRDTTGVPERSWLSPGSLARYRAAFGADWWSFAAGEWTVVGLDVQLFGSGLDAEEAQWRWLDETFADAPGPIVCCLHKPLFENRDTDADHNLRLVPHAARNRLFERLAAHDVRLVLSGHAHQHLDRVVDDVRHVWMPSCAFVFPDSLQPRLAEKIVGVGVLELDGDDYRFDVVAPDAMRRLGVDAIPSWAR